MPPRRLLRLALRPVAVLGLTGTLVVLHPARADAQGSEESEKSAATRALEKGHRGIRLYEEGKWIEALELFKEADALYHSPVFVLYWARSLRNAGRLIEAREPFRRLSVEELDPSAPAQWRQAQSDGRAELAALDRRIPRLVVTVKGSTPRTRITVDGEPARAGESIELDPGDHRVVVQEGSRKKERTVTLAPEAKDHRVEMSLAAETSGPGNDAAPPSRGPYVPGLIVTGTGGVAMIAGGVVGALALTKASDANDNLPASCVDRVCPESRRSTIENAADTPRDLATVSNVLLIGGAAVAVVGVVLLLIDPRAEPAVTANAGRAGGSLAVRF